MLRISIGFNADPDPRLMPVSNRVRRLEIGQKFTRGKEICVAFSALQNNFLHLVLVHCNETPIYVFPEKELSPITHRYMSVYIGTEVRQFLFWE